MQANQLDTDSNSYLTRPTVKVIVGETMKSASRSFFIHAGLLTSRSPFFANALKSYKPFDENTDGKSFYDSEHQCSQWREGMEGVVHLPQDEPEVFSNYVQLLYYGVLPIGDDPKEPEPTEDKTVLDKFKKDMTKALSKVYLMLAKIYVLCEKLQDITSKGMLLASFIEESSRVRGDGNIHYPHLTIIGLIFFGTVEGDPLRAFVVDYYVYVAPPEWTRAMELYSKKFLYDVMVGMIEKRAAPADISKLKDKKYYQDKLAAFAKGKVKKGKKG